MDYFIIFVTTVAGLYYQTLDGPRSGTGAGGERRAEKTFMLQQLANAQAQKIKRGDLPKWLEAASASYPGR